MKTVFVVDDEESIQTLVAYNFERAGFEVKTESNGKIALDRLMSEDEHFDLVVLDIMLPDMDGLEICKHLRSNRNDIPIILLTARDDEIDRILGLEIGADDYVTKPFSPRELVARAKSTLRRVEPFQDEEKRSINSTALPVLRCRDITMDLTRHEVLVKNVPVELTPREFELLKYMLEHVDQALSRDRLSNHVWGYDDVTGTRIVDVHVSHLRDKIEPDPKKPQYIKTVRGVGYKLSLNPDER